MQTKNHFIHNSRIVRPLGDARGYTLILARVDGSLATVEGRYVGMQAGVKGGDICVQPDPAEPAYHRVPIADIQEMTSSYDGR